MADKTAPELRFKGFTDDWELCKLGDVSENFEYGLNASATAYDGVNKYIRITDIDEASHLFLQDNLTSPDVDFNSADDYLLEENDILFVRTGASVGKTYKYRNTDGKVYYAGFLIRAKVKSEFDSSFIFQNTLTNQYDNFIKVTSQRSGQPGVNAKEYASYTFHVPKKVEQEKIGTFFKVLDDTITLHQRKLDLLTESKQAFLQQFFPQKGQKEPTVRFSGFSGDWEQRKLGDYLSVPVKEPVEVKGTSELMTLKLNLGGLYSGTNRETLTLGSTVYYKRYAGQLIYGKQNFFNGSMAIIPDDLNGKATSGDVPSLNINNIDRNYLYIYISRQNYWKLAENYASGTGSKRIHESTLLKFPITVPSIEEQKKISQFFQIMDKQIKLASEKLTQLENLKKAYLQKMFI